MTALIVVAVLVPLIWLQSVRSPAPAMPFAPDQWPKKELDHYLALQSDFFDSQTKTGLDSSAEASKGIIATVAEPLAVHAGIKVLQQGGNAADAALTTSLAQIALTAGAAISYAGVMTAVYYDAASDKVYTLNAAYNTVKNETEPWTIPPTGEHSGRTALVPGFMAGVQALHDRFGKLPFSTLFQPSIWIAEHGVTFSRLMEYWLDQSQTFVTRLPEAKGVFTKPNQQLYKTGNLFRQPALAETLKKVASRGSDYMYKGEWARHFVDAVQREGGKITMDDLASYRPMWTEPLRLPYHDYDVVSLGLPNIGGLMTLGSLKLAEVAEIKKYRLYTIAPDALYYMIQIARVEKAFARTSADSRRSIFRGLDPSPESQLSQKAAEQMLAHIRNETKSIPPTVEPGGGHSSGVIAVDEQGKVAFILNSLKTVPWGTTGIFVDGVSIPDSAVFQQREIAEAGPGVRLPEPTNPLIVLKNGKPVLVSTAVGEGLHEVTFQNLVNVLEFGMDLRSSVVQPNTRGPYLGITLNAPPRPQWDIEAVEKGFSESVLDGVRARGQEVRVIPDNEQAGYWVGVQINPLLTHRLIGAASRKLPSFVEGY